MISWWVYLVLVFIGIRIVQNYFSFCFSGGIFVCKFWEFMSSNRAYSRLNILVYVGFVMKQELWMLRRKFLLSKFVSFLWKAWTGISRNLKENAFIKSMVKGCIDSGKLLGTYFEFCTCLGCETKKGVGPSLVIFQDEPRFGHVIQMAAVREFH